MQSKGMLGYKSEEGQKSTRYYLRFHQTIMRAIELNRQIYGDQVGKDNKEKRIEHPLRVAGMTEEIAEQSLQDYHLNWLVGVLHDSQEDDPMLYGEKIEEVLQDLLPEEREVVIRYINQLVHALHLLLLSLPLAQTAVLGQLVDVPDHHLSLLGQ